MRDVPSQESKPQSLSYQPNELAGELGVSRQLIYRGLRDGSIPSIRMGKRFLIPRSAIQEWLRTAGGGQIVNAR